MDMRPVFYDPRGRRERLAPRLGVALALLVAIGTTLFGLSLLAMPLLPPAPGLAKRPPVLPMLTMTPDPRCRIPGSTAWAK